MRNFYVPKDVLYYGPSVKANEKHLFPLSLYWEAKINFIYPPSTEGRYIYHFTSKGNKSIYENPNKGHVHDIFPYIFLSTYM